MLVEKCNLCADVYSTGISKDIGVSDCCLTPPQQFFMARTS